MKKRLLAILMTVALLLTLLPTALAEDVQTTAGGTAAETTAASSGTCGDHLTWTLDDSGKLTISGTGEMDDYDETDSGNGSPWYSRRASIKEVEIGENVTSIGSQAFYNCENLTSVHIPDGVTCIGDEAFYYCTSLTGVDIPDGVTSIGEAAFSSCDDMTEVHIPDTVTTIDDRAFDFCRSLTSVDIPASVTSIGEGAFDQCTGLESVHITDLHAWCSIQFQNEFSNPLVYAGELVLNGQPVTELVIPEDAADLSYAFYGCTSLISVELPDCLTAIGKYAFGNCSSLTEVHIGAGVTRIEGTAFEDCSSLSSIQVSANNGTYCSKDGVLYNKNCTELCCYPAGGPAACEIPDGVTSIGEYAFADCHSLTSVSIPDSVTEIGACAFYRCYGLTDVCIPDSVTDIGYDAFALCCYLKNVDIGAGVTRIGDEAFFACYRLTSVNIPDSVTDIGFGAFHECESLTSVELGTGVESIDDYAFMSCFSLKEVTFMGNAPEMSIYAFYNSTVVTAYYPNGNSTWSSQYLEQYDGWVTLQPASAFTDVQWSQYYYRPVLWASKQEITAGTSKTTFSPNQTCTRGQVVTFLWRAAGKPTVSGTNPFVDVKQSDYFYDAVLWAVSKGITNGTDATHFSPNAKCTRGQVVTFMYRAAEKPAVSGSSPFADVKKSDYFYDAVLWAVANGITNGTDATHFSPNASCTRGQVVTFLYRDLGK